MTKDQNYNIYKKIDKYYQDCKKPGTYAQEPGFTDKEIIQLAVEENQEKDAKDGVSIKEIPEKLREKYNPENI